MTLFEYLAAGNTLVLSLAATRIISGLPNALDSERRFWPHTICVLCQLYMVAAMFWVFWGLNGATWTFSSFLVQLAVPGTLYFMVACLIPENADTVESWETHYYSIHRQYWLGTIAYVAAVVGTYVLIQGFEFHQLRERPGLGLIVAMGIAGAASSKPKVHYTLAGILVVVLPIVALTAFSEAGESANLGARWSELFE